jgi:dTDP-4-dehydrorhamnose 3,5-epimerase
MMKHSTKIPGCYRLELFSFQDERGRFLKIYHEPTYKELQIETDWREEFYSFSKKGVLRGMHFQVPPYEHNKLVCCLHGKVLDVVLDLRKGSPTFGEVEFFNLEENDSQAIYIPKGLAHGFLALSDNALVQYKVSSIHQHDSDSGIFWESIPFAWPIGDAIISDRDAAHPLFSDFDSPFEFSK